MTDQSFTVTLPSNSNMQTDPTNRGSKYIVRLSAPLNFGGQTLNDDVNWEVALTSLQYTNSFYNVREAAVIHVLVQIPRIADIAISVPTMRGVVQYSETLSARDTARLSSIEQRYLKQLVKAAGSTDTSFVVHAAIHIPAGHYRDVQAIHEIIVHEFNRQFGGGRYNTTTSALIHADSGTVNVQIEPNTNKLHLFTAEASILSTLGVNGIPVDTDDPPLYRMTTKGFRTPRFDTVQALYVYSDIVKHQHVGNTLAPLLEIVPVQGAPGQRMHYTFNQLTYLPVNRTYIEAICVEIYDEHGNPVTFPDDVENVICRLRFRQVKHNMLML